MSETITSQRRSGGRGIKYYADAATFDGATGYTSNGHLDNEADSQGKSYIAGVKQTTLATAWITGSRNRGLFGVVGAGTLRVYGTDTIGGSVVDLRVAGFCEDSIWVTAMASFEMDQFAITDCTATDPTVVTSAGHTYSNDELIVIDGITDGTFDGGAGLTTRRYMVKNVTANTYELYRVDGTTTVACTVQPSVFGASGQYFIYKGDVDVSPEVPVAWVSGSTIDQTDTFWEIGSNGSGAYFVGCLKNIGYHNTFIDFSKSANRSRIIDNQGQMLDPGNGSNYFGVQPLMMFQEPSPNFGITNSGIGQDFILGDGSGTTSC